MDFLDPRKKRAYKARLITGYILMALVIAMAAYLLANISYGYNFSTKTHTIIQNGLLFVDSKPGGAAIDLSGTQRGSTSARLNLPAATYSLKLTKGGYRTWQRSVEVDAGAVAYYVYPFLFPKAPVSVSMQSYATAPPLFTQTPDQHWLLVQTAVSSSASVNFDEYDASKPTQAAQVLSLPDSVLTNPGLPGSSLSLVEWSTDNNHVLLQHGYQGGSEFIVFDRSDPSQSFNVNRLFGVNPSQVALRNKSINQLYIYDQSAQTLRVGDTTKGVLDPVFLKNVLAFKAYGSSLLTYVTDNNMPSGQAQARIWSNGPTYALYNFSAGSHYLIDAAQYQGHWYYIAGSDTDDRVDIFEDPLSDIQNSSIGKALPTIALRVMGADKVSFSNNARFVEVESGQSFGVYDFENKARFQYIIKAPLAGDLQWMDGSRLIGDSNNTVFVTDYDGTNQQLLVPTMEAAGGYFSSDFNHLFTVAPSANGGNYDLNNVDMRAGSDLPKT